MCMCVYIQVYLQGQEAAKVSTQLHIQHLTGSLGSKIERKEVFLTKDTVTWVSNRTAVDFNATRCYAYGPRNLTGLGSGGKEGCGQTQMLPLEPQLEQPAAPRPACTTQPCAAPWQKGALWIQRIAQGDICADTSMSRDYLPPPPPFFFLLRKLIFKRNYFRHYITSFMTNF